MTARQRATRAGFTLVEVMVVIAIIAILASLLTVAVLRTGKTAKIVQARNDISQLETVAANFKKDFGFYPPSHVGVTGGVVRFMVPTHGIPNTLTGAQAEQNNQSLQLLQRMFPRWQPITNPATGQIIGRQDDYPAANQYSGPLPLAGTALDPNQAIVYFLGGPASLDSNVTAPQHNPAASTVTPVPAQQGFDTASPYAPAAAGTTKKGPYFDFPSGRVKEPDGDASYAKAGNGLPSFVDPWGVPYAYFAAGGDSYDGRLFFPFGTSAAASGTVYQNTAGATLTPPQVGMRAVRLGNKWANPGKVQIVSAGPNQKFGPGTQSASATAPSYTAANDIKPGQTTGYAEKDDGEDDLANFNEGANLGTAP